MIESVNLSVWFDDGNQNEIELSPMQTFVVLKLLGIESTDNEYINCYSDQTLEQFIKMKGNPLKLISSPPKKQE